MKKILSFALLLILNWQIDAQTVKSKPDKPLKVKGFERTVGKGLNSPFNYFGYRPLYNDTMYINLDQGQKIEIVYDWFDLFRSNEDAYNDFFWLPFNAKYNLLKDKVRELALDNKFKYHITLKDVKANRALPVNNAQYYNNDSLYRSEMNKSFSRQRELFDGMKQEERDSLNRVMMDKFYSEQYPVNSIISVIERKADSEHREYKLKGKEIVGQAQWQHILEVNSKDWNFRFYINDLDDLSALDSLDLNAFFRSERENFIRNRYYKYHTCLNFTLIDGKLKYQHNRGEKKRKRTRCINISWTPVVGTSIVKSEWSADIGAQVGVVVNDKQQWANRLSLRYQLKGIGEETIDGREMKYNGFVDAMWDVNMADNYKREQWLGAGLGYLVHKDGNIYDDNTARIFLKYRSSQLWGIQPEFNYSFNDNKGFIGLGFFFSL